MSKLEPALSRRDCLHAFATGICALSLSLTLMPAGDSVEQLPQWIRRCGARLGDRVTLLRWGSLYLEQHPEERHTTSLTKLLAGTARASFPKRLLARIEADFRTGDLAVVDGWVLARSEARLCALMHLVGSDA